MSEDVLLTFRGSMSYIYETIYHAGMNNVRNAASAAQKHFNPSKIPLTVKALIFNIFYCWMELQ